MDTVKLSALHREGKGKGACRRMRSSHRIPGVIYGRNRENMLVEFSEMEILDVIKRYGEHALINLEMDGNQYSTMIKEVQKDPAMHSIKHVDLKFIDEGEKVHADIPIVIKGEERVRSKGGVVQKQMGVLSVEASPDKLPKFLVADVSSLDVGDKLTVADVEFSSDISVADDIHSVIAVISNLKEKETTQDINEQQTLDDTQTQHVYNE